MAVEVDDVVRGLARFHLPVGARLIREEVERLASDDAPEPIVLVGERQVLQHPEATPTRRQHREPKLRIGQTLHRAEHVCSLRVEEPQQHVRFAHPSPPTWTTTGAVSISPYGVAIS